MPGDREILAPVQEVRRARSVPPTVPRTLIHKDGGPGLQLWQEYERRWNLKLFFRSGALRMAGADDSYESAALPVLKEAGIRFEKLSAAECATRWPQMNFDGVSWSVYEPDSGFLAARRGCEAVLRRFSRRGAISASTSQTRSAIASNRNGTEYDEGQARSSKLTFMYLRLVHGSGRSSRSWHQPSLRPVRKSSSFGTPAGDVRFTEEHLPTWIDGGKRPFFGVPGNHWRGFKIADDTRGPVIDPSTMEREISEEKLSAAREYLRMRFPAMADAPLLESRVCQYENSTDHNFILDRHPEAENVWIVGGGSGHGFKHGPVMGEMAANAILDSKTPPPEMALSRLLRVSPFALLHTPVSISNAAI